MKVFTAMLAELLSNSIQLITVFQITTATLEVKSQKSLLDIAIATKVRTQRKRKTRCLLAFNT
jgi:hypothetical protein